MALTVPRTPAAARARRSLARTPGLRRLRRRDELTAFAFMLPGLGGFTLFVLIPTVAGLALSFFNWDLFGSPRWAGIDNYRRLFTDAQVWASLEVTVLFVVLGVVPTILVGFMLAALSNVRFPGVGVVRVLYLAPMVASTAVAAVLWSYMYEARAGVINRVLGWFGIKGEDWLTNTTWALPAVVLMLIWLALPLVTILYLAGLQRIPDDIYEAAELDGAGAWRRMWWITWPNVRRTTVLVVILQMINFVSSSFETSLIMTNGGPLNHTETLTLYAYETAFGSYGSGDLGYASALTIFQLALFGAIAGLIRLGRVMAGRLS